MTSPTWQPRPVRTAGPPRRNPAFDGGPRPGPDPRRRPVLLASLLGAFAGLVYVALIEPSGVVTELPWVADGYAVAMAAGTLLVVTAPAGRAVRAWVWWWLLLCAVGTVVLWPAGDSSEVVVLTLVLGTFVYGAVTAPAGILYAILQAVLPPRPDRRTGHVRAGSGRPVP
ncbi:hypothetical protein [Propionicicella superfundia]|uniref:hypothetical protein n=1 Tax=Propionicicella superfundia TaxID=348582 RepID=UPI000490B4D0|nr:hypothetical protein [Propionicicella superfundia]